jgi:hypothetical protein
MNTIKPNVGDGRDLERWLFSDWLNDNKSTRGGTKKEPVIPILKRQSGIVEITPLSSLLLS